MIVLSFVQSCLQNTSDLKNTMSPLIHPPIDFHRIPVVDKYYKVHETLCEFDIFEMYCWIEDKFIDKYDDIQLCESNSPHYISPHTHITPKFFRKCHECFLPSQRAIIAPTREILFTITPQAIDQMATHFSH